MVKGRDKKFIELGNNICIVSKLRAKIFLATF